MRLLELLQVIEAEKLELPDLDVGDELMVGKFKNRKATIKGFSKDKHNQPIAATDKGDQQIFKGRVKKLMDEARIAGISKKDAIEIVREIETGRGGIGELAKRKPALMKLSQDNLRREYGDVVPLFRVLGIPEDKEMRPEGIVSTTTDWKVAVSMGRDQPGMIMGRDKWTSIHTVLVRYDVPIEKCLADVNLLLEMVVEKLGGFDVIGSKSIRGRRSGERVPVSLIIREGMKEDEVIADVSGLKPVVLRFGSHVGGQKEMRMLHGMEAGEFNSPEEYMQHRIDTKYANEYFPPEEEEELKAMYAKRSPDVKRFLGMNEDINFNGENKRAVKPKRAGDDVLMTIPTAVMDAAFKRDGMSFYVGPGGSGAAIGDRYQRFAAWIQDSDSYEVPEVSVSSKGVLVFTNGRHRYAVLRDAGVDPMPVAMSPESVRYAQKLLRGTVT